MESEKETTLDLRPYVNALVRRWPVVVVITLVATLLAGIYTSANPAPYKATASVVIVKTKSEVTFDPNFKTTTTDSSTSFGGAISSADAQRSAFLGLVKNSNIAANVIKQMGDQFPPSQRNPAVLLNSVDASLLQKGDLIQISAIDPYPDRAAAIANAWAHEYETSINGLYGGAPSDYSSSVQTELQRTKQDYEKSQAALEAFIATSQIDSLNRKIGETQQIIGALENGKQNAVATVISEGIKSQTQVISAYLGAQSANRLIAFQKEQEAARARVSAGIDAQTNAENVVFNEQVKANIQKLQDYYASKLKIERVLADAQSVRQQVSNGGDAAAASNGLTLVGLKAQAFSVGLPQLQVQLNSVIDAGENATTQLADIDALISALQKRDSELDKQISDQSKALLSGEGYNFITSTVPTTSPLAMAVAAEYAQLFNLGSLAALTQEVPQDTPLASQAAEQVKVLLQLQQFSAVAIDSANSPLDSEIDKLSVQIQTLQTQLAHQTAISQQLTQRRDQDWGTYTTLSKKQAEVSIAGAVTGSVVRFAAPAVTPNTRMSSPVTTIMKAGLLGLFLSLLLALLPAFLGGGTTPQATRREPEPVLTPGSAA